MYWGIADNNVVIVSGEQWRDFPGEFHWQTSLANYSPGHSKELDKWEIILTNNNKIFNLRICQKKCKYWEAEGIIKGKEKLVN